MLTRLAYESKASWGYPQAWMEEWAPELCITAEYIRDRDVFVAQSEEDILGMVGMANGDNGPELEHFWLDPERQGTGVGRRLLEHAMLVAREKGWSSLRILSDPYAQPFYERFGAIKIGEHPAPVAGTARTLPVLRLDL